MTYLLIGPEITGDLKTIENHFVKNNLPLKIYGNKEDLIDCKSLALPKYAQVIIHAHGEIDHLELCNGDRAPLKQLKTISKSNPLNFELFSCFSGSVISSSTSSLSKWSTLITSTSANQELIGPIAEKNILDLANVSSNPFTRFAAYIFLTADKLKFAIKPENQKVFLYSTGSSFDAISNFSDVSILNWQNNQLNKFLDFTKTIKSKMNKERSNQIDEFTALFQDNKKRDEFIAQFDVKIYKGLMVINESARNNLKKLSALIEGGSLLTEKTIDGFNGLMLAVQNGHYQALKKLINAGVPLNEKNKDGFAALHIAVQFNDHKMVKMLLDAGASINEKRRNDGLTALHMALYSDISFELIQILIDAGASLNDKDDLGFTALHIAVSKLQIKEVQKLIDAGASLNEKSNDGITILHIAAYRGYYELNQKLIDAGVSLNEKAKDGTTALHMAASNIDVKVVQQLIDAGASLNEKAKDGTTALHKAVANLGIKVVQQLIDAGASLNEKSNNGFTLLHVAAYKGSYELTQKLIDAGVPLSKKDNDGFSAFDLANKLGYQLVAQKLKDAEESAIKNSPIDYILNYYNEAKLAIIHFNSMKKMDIFAKLIPVIEQTEGCLKEYLEEPEVNLSDVCGVSLNLMEL